MNILKRIYSIVRQKATGRPKKVWKSHTVELRSGPVRVSKEVPLHDVVALNYSDRGGTHVGYMWISDDRPDAFLWFVYVLEDKRRQGYGTAMIRHLQSCYNEIQTHYLHGMANSAGTQLLVKSGFTVHPPIHKRQPGYIVWRRQ